MKKKLLLLSLLASTLTHAQTLGIQSFATGLSSTVAITHAPNDTRLFVVQKGGQIRIVNPNGTINSTPFLTVSGLSNGSEQGLLGLAFHPNYATNGTFFINYTNTSGDTVIAKYTVSANPNIANATGTIIMTVDQPFSNHNGGSLKFGPDGYLYIGLGDGGSGGDPNGYAQNLNVDPNFPSRVFLGKMLRIDVDSASPYGIPPSNPYVGQTGKQEIWAYGLRNPWKYSFDKLTGDLWIADVGQNEIEEINKVVSPLTNAGLNFGWRCFEGSEVFNSSGCPSFSTTLGPIAEYTHSATNGCSVTGGYVYRGTTYPNLIGKYVFGDYCSGEIAYIDGNDSIVWSFESPGVITSFGEGSDGELYVTNGSSLFRLVDTSLNTPEIPKNNFKLVPNPAKQLVQILGATTSLTNVSLFEITGKKIASYAVNGTDVSIDLSSFTAGIYWIEIIDINETVTYKKLILE